MADGADGNVLFRDAVHARDSFLRLKLPILPGGANERNRGSEASARMGCHQEEISSRSAREGSCGRPSSPTAISAGGHGVAGAEKQACFRAVGAKSADAKNPQRLVREANDRCDLHQSLLRSTKELAAGPNRGSHSDLDSGKASKIHKKSVQEEEEDSDVRRQSRASRSRGMRQSHLMKRKGNYFQVLEDSSDEEWSSSPGISPEKPTLADAISCAIDLRGTVSKKKLRQKKLEVIGEKIRKHNEWKTNMMSKSKSAESLPPAKVQVTHTPCLSSVSDGKVASENEQDEDGGTWYKIFGGKPVRQTLDPLTESWRALGMGGAGSVLLRQPTATANNHGQDREKRKPGDDIRVFSGIQVQIKTVGLKSKSMGKPGSGPTQQVSGGGEEVVGCRPGAVSFGNALSCTTTILTPLLAHLWGVPARVREGAAAESQIADMGDRFDGGSREGYGGGEGGTGRQNQFQYRPNQSQNRPPYPRPNYYQANQYYQGNSQYQNNQFNRRDNYQYSGKNFVPKGQSGSGNNSQEQKSSGGEERQSAAAPGGKATGTIKSATQSKGAAGGSSEGAISVADKSQEVSGGAVQCNKCNKKGHATKECKEDVECANCGKGHLSTKCAWLKQKKPVASLVGFGGPGLCCFVADHAKENVGEDKGKAVAIVKVQQVDFEVDAELLEMCLGRTYPWKWEWQAKKIATGAFLVNFPSATRVNEVAIYDWVTLRGAHIKINVKQWSDESLAAGKLDTVWVRAKRVPNTLKNYQGLCEVGSTIGQVIEVDMETFRRDGSIRILCGVVDHKKIPAMAKLTTKKLMIYYIYFQLEQVVEEGWVRPEEEYIQNFDEMEDNLSQEFEFRDLKKQKLDQSKSKGVVIQASEGTKKALENLAQTQKEQEAIDAATYGTGTSNVNNKQNPSPSEMVKPAETANNLTVTNGPSVEGTGENGLRGDSDMDPMDTNSAGGRVDLSGNGQATSDSSVSIGTKIRFAQDGKDCPKKKNINKPLGVLEEIEETNAQRCSDRLASKSDMPIMDRAKSLAKAKNLQTEEGKKSTFLQSSDANIVDIAKIIGIDLGASIDLIEHNLSILNKQEQARVNIFLASKKGEEETPDIINTQQEVVGDVLMELLQLSKQDNEEMDDNVFVTPFSHTRTDDGGKHTPRVVHLKTPVKTRIGKKGCVGENRNHSLND